MIKLDRTRARSVRCSAQKHRGSRLTKRTRRVSRKLTNNSTPMIISRILSCYFRYFAAPSEIHTRDQGSKLIVSQRSRFWKTSIIFIRLNGYLVSQFGQNNFNLKLNLKLKYLKKVILKINESKNAEGWVFCQVQFASCVTVSFYFVGSPQTKNSENTLEFAYSLRRWQGRKWRLHRARFSFIHFSRSESASLCRANERIRGRWRGERSWATAWEAHLHITAT